MEPHKKEILVDASSALLLYRAGIFDKMAESFSVVMPKKVSHELIRCGREGAEDFNIYCRLGTCTIAEAPAFPGGNIRLGGGERELVLLYLSGRGVCIVLDDRKGAAYCRRHDIPYINALLVPKVLMHAGIITEACCEERMRLLISIGRYAGWVVDYARNAAREDIKLFLP